MVEHGEYISPAASADAATGQPTISHAQETNETITEPLLPTEVPEATILPVKQADMSRRSFLKRGGIAALGVAGIVAAREPLKAASRLALDHLRALRPNEQYLEDNQYLLDRTRLGCSFAPELSPLWGNRDEAMRALRTTVEVFGFNDIRFGIRWDYSKDNNDIDTHYAPYLHYLLSQPDMNVCLNLGIKVFRYPEIWLPPEIKNRTVSMPPTAVIGMNSWVAQESLRHYTAILDYMADDKHFSAEQRSRIHLIQPENEAFHSFGSKQCRWTMGDDYITALIDATRPYFSRFPNAGIMLNSAGRSNLDQIYALQTDLLDRPDLEGKLTSGFNYYYRTPMNDYPVIKLIDNVISLPSDKSCAQNLRDNEKTGIAMEISELQMEEYGSVKSPGNSIVGLRFALLRGAEQVLGLDSIATPKTIRIWGVERFYENLKTPSQDQLQMAELLTTINGKAFDYNHYRSYMLGHV